MVREAIIDLQAHIDCLRSVKSDLEAYYWDQSTGEDVPQPQREEVTFWIRLIADRTLALESVLLQKGASRVVVSALDGGTHAAIADASRMIDRWIPEDEAFDTVRSAVAAILAAADTIALRAITGQPARRPRLA